MTRHALIDRRADLERQIARLALFLAGWGVWVVVFRPFGVTGQAFRAFPEFGSGGLASGAAYTLIGAGALVATRRHADTLAVSLVLAGTWSIAALFVLGALQSGEYNTGVYTYGFIALRAAQVARDYGKTGWIWTLK